MHTRNYYRALLFSSIVAALFATPSIARAQNSQSGEIVLEDTEQTRRPSKEIYEEQANEFLNAVEAAAKSGSGSPKALTEGAAQHLGVVYLYCLKKLGPCPYILDAILEADVLNARSSGSAECPSMSRFWKEWLDNQLEQRVKYVLSIGHAAAVADFNTLKRPGYVKCKGTVEKLKGESGRYGSSGSATAAIEKTKSLVSDINEQRIDMYAAVGFDVGTRTRKK